MSFKQAVNDAIHEGLAQSPGRRGRLTVATAGLGVPRVNLDRVLQLAGQLEDEELIRKMRLGK